MSDRGALAAIFPMPFQFAGTTTPGASSLAPGFVAPGRADENGLPRLSEEFTRRDWRGFLDDDTRAQLRASAASGFALSGS